ncbi:nitrite reductase small subunit NirD [Deefgea sp. CFH1-16]|uniref:nitrite reductase small subunit NirD n=1 Tax=Deefgea sp. CFH1-16 TaxID=2675457 RepID=UPI0015F42617|nr:nitrite reductase small subunit NirD [Deefgea sp. CFH1-16]MBM5575252.1 nitrite reductase small subunit NirD [Deefgea sp. CFH1-16]
MNWNAVCDLKAILPGTGVCALVGERQVAIFRPYADEQVFALDNIDPPFAGASVLSRGLIAEHDGELWVASPLKKQRFRLRDGVCYESTERSIQSYPARVVGQQVEVQI